MGGVWGLAASTALENLPVEVRGLASGVLQQGYAVGYLLAACINLTLVPDTATTWRSLFWTASGISLFAACVRATLPESAVFLRAKAAERARGTDTSQKTKVFIRETKTMLKTHWLLCIYAVLLMTGKYITATISRRVADLLVHKVSTFCHTALRYVCIQTLCGVIGRSDPFTLSNFRICIPRIFKRRKTSAHTMPQLRQSSETV